MAPSWLKWAELPARTDAHTDKGTTKWGNHDLYPIIESERTYGTGAYLLYWVTCGGGLSTFAIGSSYVVVGLTAGETCGAVLIGACLASLNAVLMGRVGAINHLGYTMTTRVSFGMRGMWLPLFFMIMSNVVFFGLQAYYGGQAISLMLGAIFPQWHHMKNTLPVSAGTTTSNLVGFFLYIILYVPVILFIAPHKLEPFMWPAFIGTIGTVFGIMAYAVNMNHGSPGNLVSPVVVLSATSRGFRFVQCISTVVGTYGGSADRFSDWTRFAKKKNSPLLGSITGMPITITLCALLGVLTASATRAHYGTTYWQPLTYLQFIQSSQYTAGGRAATFFAGLSIFLHQMFVNVTQNNLGAGMDLAGIWPRYISMSRGSIIVCILGIIVQPWRFFTQATVFLSVISSFGVFTGPTTAILIIDYYVIRKGKWKIPDLFHGGPEYIYWYVHGINPRSWAAYIIATIPSFPGLVMNIMGKSNAAVKIYQLNYVVGFGISAILFYTTTKLFPPPGIDIAEPFDESIAVLEGESSPGEGSIEESKDAAIVSKTEI